MTIRYTYTGTLCWGGDVQTGEAEVTCTYSVDWDAPTSGFQVAPYAEVVDIEIGWVDGKRAASLDCWSYGGTTLAEALEGLVFKLECDHHDEMIEAATEVEVEVEERREEAAEAEYDG